MELSCITGLGKTRIESLNEAGIFSCKNLLDYFPKKYYNFLSPSPFAPDGTYKMIKGKVIAPVKVSRIRKNFSIVTAKMIDSFGGEFSAIWYNQPFVKNALKENTEYFVYGKDAKNKKNSLMVSYFKSVDKSEGLSFFPVYKNIENVHSEIIRKSIAQILEKQAYSSQISPASCETFELMELMEAYSQCHFPSNIIDLEAAKNRILLEKLVPIVYMSENSKKLGRDERKHTFAKIDEIYNEYKQILPFVLTHSQMTAISDIIKDLESNQNMNRLLEGDVGSGKTAVAMFCLFVAARNGYQAAMLAPTEILATEHYKLALKMFNGVNGVNIVFLSSSMTSAEKKAIVNKIKTGEANIIIGSHSIFSKSVEYNNLAFAVIDEQHKFGVKHRANLLEKGENVDTLTMSATPIPRSLALVFEGSLDISILKARPHAQNVQTNIVGKHKERDMWKFVNDKIKSGSKVFVVCPKIEEDDDDTLSEQSAIAVHKYLSSILNTEVALVHGKMKAEETNILFENFKSGKTRVIVSTTIVEVGVDAKDADIMVIMQASNFGLASLHQLRGRVGRDGRQSWCFCVVPNDISSKSLERLSFFKKNTDGFKIAEYDLESRGAGNLSGYEQHGLDSNEVWGYSIDLFEQAKRIVSYMKNRGETIEMSQELYEGTVGKLIESVAMN